MALTRPRSYQLLDSDFKASCRVATTGDVTLSGGAPNSVDNVSVVKGNRILVWQQNTATQNGIYVVQTVGTGSNGTWVRANDFDTSAKISAGLTVRIEQGDLYKDVAFTLTTDNPITLNSTNLTFAKDATVAGTDTQVQYNDNGALAGSPNLTFNGTTLSTNALNVTNDAVIGGNLTVNGQTTTINSTVATIDDLNLTLASGAASAALANGAGLTIDGANATLTYLSTPNLWSFDRGLQVNGQVSQPAISAPASPAADNVIIYVTASGTSPNREVAWKMKNELGQEIIIASILT